LREARWSFVRGELKKVLATKPEPLSISPRREEFANYLRYLVLNLADEDKTRLGSGPEELGYW
jgi:hypothetical protein